MVWTCGERKTEKEPKQRPPYMIKLRGKYHKEGQQESCKGTERAELE